MKLVWHWSQESRPNPSKHPSQSSLATAVTVKGQRLKSHNQHWDCLADVFFLAIYSINFSIISSLSLKGEISFRNSSRPALIRYADRVKGLKPGAAGAIGDHWDCIWVFRICKNHMSNLKAWGNFTIQGEKRISESKNAFKSTRKKASKLPHILHADLRDQSIWRLWQCLTARFASPAVAWLFRPKLWNFRDSICIGDGPRLVKSCYED